MNSEINKVMEKVIDITRSTPEYIDYIDSMAIKLNKLGIRLSRDKITRIDNPGDNYDVYDIVDETYIFIHQIYNIDRNREVVFHHYEVQLYGCASYALKDLKLNINK